MSTLSKEDQEQLKKQARLYIKKTNWLNGVYSLEHLEGMWKQWGREVAEGAIQEAIKEEDDRP